MAGSNDGQQSTKPLPPGKLGLPWIGESLAIAANNHGFYKDRFAKYGPIFKTRLFGINFVVFSGPEGMERFANDPAIVRGGADPLSVQQIFVNSLALTDGPPHRERKAAMLKSMQHRDALEKFLPRMERIMTSYVARWEKAGDVKMMDELFTMAAEMSGAIFTGDESKAGIEELRDAVTAMRGAFMTPPIAIPGTTYGRAIAGRKRLQALILRAIARHRTGSYDTALSTMLAEADKAGRTEEKVAGDLLHLLFAGQGGYTVPLTVATLTLPQFPALMEQARAEVMAVAPEGPLTMEHMDKLEFLERFSKEIRRYYAMNSATFFGRVTAPMEVGGYSIPAGWGAIGAIHITMRSSAVYDDPTKFDPDRFLPERIEARPPGSYVPHGHGPRSGHKCPAEDMVAMTVKAFFAIILRRNTTWTLPPQDLTLSNELFPLPVSGLNVHFEKWPARSESLPRPAEGLARR